MDGSVFEVPSFSLGLEFDSERPSFSLGFEDENESPNRNQVIDVHDSDPEPQWRDSISEREDHADEVLQGCLNEEPLPRLKRLKRGPPQPTSSTTPPNFEVDDIEDFSSDDDFLKEHHKSLKTPVLHRSSSGKLSLHGLRVLKIPSQNSNCTPSNPGIKSSSILGETSGGKKPTAGERLRQLGEIHRLTCKFSDEENDDIVVGRTSGKCNSKDNDAVKSVSGCQKIGEIGKKVPSQISQKCFNVIQNSNLPSLALDEFCDEYFHSVKTTNDGISAERHHSVVDKSVPQAYQYFDSEDMRIQKLVRQRLHNFLPINAVMRGEGQGAEPVEIDFLGQFGGSQDASAARGVNLQTRCSKEPQKKYASRRSVKGKRPIPRDSGNCNRTAKRSRLLEPGVPQDAGKRRVTAGGRWYKDQSGKKIYITKDGQEMIGRAAYMSYKKDNVNRHRKPRKRFKKRVTKKK